MADTYKTFGAYLRRYREERGLHLREVARKAEMSHAYLSQVERGEPRNLSDEKLVALGHALGHESLPELFARAGRVAPLESEIIRQNPEVWSSFILTCRYADLHKLKKVLEKASADMPSLGKGSDYRAYYLVKFPAAEAKGKSKPKRQPDSKAPQRHGADKRRDD
jgi:transcriptional regulator with XRE-family HTH domain